MAICRAGARAYCAAVPRFEDARCAGTAPGACGLSGAPRLSAQTSLVKTLVYKFLPEPAFRNDVL
eukprot:6673604-Prymnesium_polylepis.1